MCICAHDLSHFLTHRTFQQQEQQTHVLTVTYIAKDYEIKEKERKEKLVKIIIIILHLMVKNQIFESSPKSKIPNLSYKVISKDFTSKISIKYDK